MEWVKLLIPLIAIAVWILSHLASSQKEPPRRALPPRPGPPEQDESSRPRSSSAELEGFLEEMRHRKQYEKDQPVEAAGLEETPRARPQPPPLPRREPPPRREPLSDVEPRRVDRRDDRRDERRDEQREQRRRSRPVGSKPPQRRAEPVIVITPVEQAPPAPTPRQSTPTITAGANPTPLTVSAGPSIVLAPMPAGPLTLQHIEPPSMQRPVAPAARMVADLLKNRQSLAAAFLLREILDRPLSQRRRY